MKGYIYVWSNSINDKKYVGQTQNAKSRAKTHLQSAKTSDTHLYRAIRKHGITNFTFQVIEEIEEDTKESLKLKLDELEIKYITEYDSYNNGYNMTIGGGGARMYKQSQEHIESRSCKGKQYTNKKTLVVKMNDDLEELCTYHSTREASKDLGKANGHVSISSAIKNNHKAYGFKWKYIENK
jgi:predicted GIY-YIG superfamily endonuclease